MQNHEQPISLEMLDEAWHRVRSRGGAAGVDGLNIDAFDAYAPAHLSALYADLQSGGYRPQAYLAVDLPKASGGHRRIVIASVRDRVAQTAVANLLQPLIEPLLHPCSFAYRRGIGVQDALAKVAEYRNRGLRYVLCADIEQFFDRVDHAILLRQLKAAGIAGPSLDWIKLWLSAAVIDRDRTEPITRGLPQGLPISPLLANFYLTPFDRAVVEAGFEFLGARFTATELLPAVPHPYEADFTPPAPKGPRRPPPQGLPQTRFLPA